MLIKQLVFLVSVFVFIYLFDFWHFQKQHIYQTFVDLAKDLSKTFHKRLIFAAMNSKQTFLNQKPLQPDELVKGSIFPCLLIKQKSCGCKNFLKENFFFEICYLKILCTSVVKTYLADKVAEFLLLIMYNWDACTLSS